MKDNLRVYKIWAPMDTLWVEWAKPVLFANAPRSNYFSLNIPKIEWISEAAKDTMIILDLPAGEGVETSLALAQLGYRPVPLYNGVYGPNNSDMIVKVEHLVSALYRGAEILSTLQLEATAPPVFMLDSNRMEGSGKKPGKYDNRWCVFPQDMPSASYVKENGIRKVIVRGDEIKNDLSHILKRYQEQNIKVYLSRDNADIKEINVVKPSGFKSLLYRFGVITGLTRNGTGGFGGKIPEPTQSSSGGRYYGLG
ncbi:hypothetical protein R2R35_01910 [Anaerocolumna sp. AGMB13020]|uniref:hypothetical protein n=1 Tax=Anaerocolumna sp. AGMB13020 TaxID=3081750 RepID=UPI00295319D8|nr:hypothetical protein [Anaerocolumna sp. AGMB13020]WOO37273.1 hypothetical protein R2R35_01910 [Anaerocolumna sp. AGMB13020]